MQFIKLIVPAAAAVVLSGCATRSYVDENLANVDSRQAKAEMAINELSVTNRQALERANDAGKLAQGKFLYSVVLTDDEVKFGSGATELSAEGEQRLTELVRELKEDNRNVYVEIQGHTDATGSEANNERLGLQRAEVVRRYLYSQGVALSRMATISYGEDMPIASNDTRDGRASNRRVAIVVLD